MYKIYVNKSYILLNNKKINEIKFDKVIYLEDLNIEKLVGFLKKEEKKVLLFDENIEKLYKHFAFNFTEIESGGGIVSNENNEFLLIFRNGKWELGENCEDNIGKPSLKKLIAKANRDHSANKLARRLLENRYRIFLTRGIKGTYIFCEDSETANFFKGYL